MCRKAQAGNKTQGNKLLQEHKKAKAVSLTALIQNSHDHTKSRQAQFIQESTGSLTIRLSYLITEVASKSSGHERDHSTARGISMYSAAEMDDFSLHVQVVDIAKS